MFWGKNMFIEAALSGIWSRVETNVFLEMGINIVLMAVFINKPTLPLNF